MFGLVVVGMNNYHLRDLFGPLFKNIDGSPADTDQTSPSYLTIPTPSDEWLSKPAAVLGGEGTLETEIEGKKLFRT